MATPAKPAAKPKPKPKAARPEGIDAGDHVYIHHDSGPMAMRVLAHGKDGMTCEAEDKTRHRVTWDRYLGHKARMLHRMRLVDQGADGAVVEDDRGRRRYLAGRLPAMDSVDGDSAASPASEPSKPSKDDPLLGGMDRLAKAQTTEDHMIIFLKAAPAASRPGLMLKPITDKAGHRTQRWVQTQKKQPQGRQHKAEEAPMKHGDTVAFRHEDVEGKGKIVGSGADGVTVRDEGGREHQVRHEHLTGKVPEADQAQGQADQGGAGGGDGGDGTVPPDQFTANDYAAKHNDPNVTPEDILKSFPPDTAEKIADVSAKLKAIEPTDVRFKKDGQWTPERQAKHQEIIDEFLSEERVKAATPAEGESPTFIILGGRGGSGKSWFKNKVYDPNKFIVLDADEIKQKLPEYQGWNAAELHEESGEIFDRITEQARALGLNIVHDATMKTAKKAVALVQGFKDEGYRTEAHYMYLPPQEAAKRGVERFLGKTRRFVPPGIILGNTTNEGSFDQVKGMVDSWSFRDNNVGRDQGPRLISESGNGSERRESGFHGLPAAAGKQREVQGAGLDAKDDRGAQGKGGGLEKGLGGSGGVVLFLKAQIRGGASADLFPETVPVKGHATRTGAFVKPHTATRQKRHDAQKPAWHDRPLHEAAGHIGTITHQGQSYRLHGLRIASRGSGAGYRFQIDEGPGTHKDNVGHPLNLGTGGHRTLGDAVSYLKEVIAKDAKVTIHDAKPRNPDRYEPSKATTAAEPEHVATMRTRLAKIQGARHKTASDEHLEQLYSKRLTATPDKWKVGHGVSYQVASGGRGMQTNRGFRIIDLHLADLQATIRSVADTGLTSSGGNHDRIEDERIYLGELRRDKKYDA